MPAYPPYPKFNLHDPCAQDSANLITNGTMGPNNHPHAWGTIVDGWDPFVMSGTPPNYRWEDNEMIDPGGAQQLYTENTFDAGVYQVVKNLQPGTSYMVRWGYSLAAKSGGGYPVGNTRVQTIGRQLGIDPYGGTDPHSPNIIWGQAFFDGKPAVNIPAMQAIFVAQAAQATIYLRAIAQEGGNGENRVWMDAICMEARTEIPVQPVTPLKPPASRPDSSAQNAAVAHKPWMPINDTAALYNFAQKNNLGYPQTDEFEFQAGADGYIGQVFNSGIVYVKKGDWGNVNWVKKPAETLPTPAPTFPDWYTPLPPAARPAGALALKDFPRPSDDNGRGIHFGLDLGVNSLQTYIPKMVELGIKWALFYAGDEMQAETVAVAAWNAGIMPVIRPKCYINGGQPNWVAFVQNLKKHNIPAYIQIYNEPGDSREWTGGNPPGNYVSIFGPRWGAAAAQIYDAGGYPGLQVLGREEIKAAVDSVRAGGRMDIFNRAFFALHNYGVNHPPAYPYDARNQQDHPKATILDDDTAVLDLIEFSKWMYDLIGFVLPIIGGEGGWTYGSNEDDRYAKCEGQFHAQFHVEMYNWFKTGLLSNSQPLPDYLFSVAPWILSGFVEAEAWYGGPLGDKPATINAMKAIPPFVRKFSWDF